MSSISYQDFWQAIPTDASHQGILCNPPGGNVNESLSSKEIMSPNSEGSTEPGSSSPEGSDRRPGSSPDDSADESCSSTPPVSYDTDTPSRPSTPEVEKPGLSVALWKDSMETLAARFADPNVAPSSKHTSHGAYPRSYMTYPVAKGIRAREVATRRTAAKDKGLSAERGSELRDLDIEMAELARDLPVALEGGAATPDMHRRASAPWYAAHVPEVVTGTASTELRDLEKEMAELAREVSLSCGNVGPALDKNIQFPRLLDRGAVADAKYCSGGAGTELRDLDEEIAELTRDLPVALDDGPCRVSAAHSGPQDITVSLSAAREAAAQAKDLSGALTSEFRDREDEMAELTRELLAMRASVSS